MKKSIICFWVIMILSVSCTKSRFSTTTRQRHDGKVVYTNHYKIEKVNLKKIKAKPVVTSSIVEPAKKPAIQAEILPFETERRGGMKTSAPEPQPFDEYGITKSNPSKRVVEPNHISKPIIQIASESDTTVKKVNGKVIPTVTGQTKPPKTEKLGLFGFIFSFLGIIPVVGIPFGILGIVFGAISLRKITRNPAKYKGKGFAIAGMVIGGAMLAANILMLVAAVNAAENTPPPSYDSSSTRCRV